MRFRSRCVTFASALFVCLNAVASPPQNAEEPECIAKASLPLASVARTVAILTVPYQSQQFDQVDAALSCLMSPQVKSASGRSGASIVYWFYREVLPAHGSTAEAAQLVQRWNDTHPDSEFAQFARLRLMYAEAWEFRGNRFANETPERRMQMFLDKLGETAKAIQNAPPNVRDTPLAQNLLLAVAGDGQGLGDPEEIFRQGVAKWPDYYDFYEVRLSRLVPRWGGSWQEVEAFADYWTKERYKQDGDSLYARLYASLLLNEDPESMMMTWPKMKVGLSDLTQRYPSEENFALAAAVGCLYGDRVYVKENMAHVTWKNMVDVSWPRVRVDPSTCQ